jgi:hypothetical protein
VYCGIYLSSRGKEVDCKDLSKYKRRGSLVASGRNTTTLNDPLPGGLSSRRLPHTENPNLEKEHYIKLGLYYYCGK